MDMTNRQPSPTGKSHSITHHCCFALAALGWLCDFSSVVGREEAVEMAVQFVCFGLITLVSNKCKNYDSAIIFTICGSAPGGNSPVSVRVVLLSFRSKLYDSFSSFLFLSKWVNFDAQPK